MKRTVALLTAGLWVGCAVQGAAPPKASLGPRPTAASTLAERAASIRKAPPTARPTRQAPIQAELEPDAQEDRQIAELRKAASLYQEFIDRAGDEPAYAEAVRRSRERIGDLGVTIDFLEHGLRERRARGGVPSAPE